MCKRVYISGSQNIIIPLASHNSLSGSSYFLERKTCARVGHSMSASIVSLRVFFFDIYLSFVRLYFTFLAHHRPSPHRRVSPLISCHWILDAKTDTSNFESPRTSENTFDHFYVRRDLVTRLHPFETVKRVRK